MKTLKIFAFVILIFVLNACGTTPQPLETKNNNLKSFEDEDKFILFALRAEQVKEYDAASSIFDTIYKRSQNKEYLYRSLKNDLVAKQNEKVIKRVDEQIDETSYDAQLMRIKIIALMQLEKFEEAKTLALELVKQTQKIDDYILVSDIYVKQKKYDTAVKYLESAYIKDYNEIILDHISIILYVNLQRKKEAIAQLETHSRVHGCSELVCSRLIGFYSDTNNIDGILSAYLRLYEINKNTQIASKIVQIYGYKKDYPQMINFLQRNRTDDVTLLELYTKAKNYKKAQAIADDLYAKTAELTYLGKSAIFEYEYTKDKNSKEMLNRVMKKLKTVVNTKESPLYLNYLGYLMIVHDLDIKEGIKYVERALVIKPESAYYLDSLAWGYYKLGKCKKARKIIDKVLKMNGGDEEEVVSHAKAINKKCKTRKRK